MQDDSLDYSNVFFLSAYLPPYTMLTRILILCKRFTLPMKMKFGKAHVHVAWKNIRGDVEIHGRDRRGRLFEVE